MTLEIMPGVLAVPALATGHVQSTVFLVVLELAMRQHALLTVKTLVRQLVQLHVQRLVQIHVLEVVLIVDALEAVLAHAQEDACTVVAADLTGGA